MRRDPDPLGAARSARSGAPRGRRNQSLLAGAHWARSPSRSATSAGGL